MTRYFPNQFHSWPFSRDVCIAFTIYLMLFNIWHQINLKCCVLLLFVQSEEELSGAKKMHIWWIYLSFWFKPYGAMIYSFFNQKFSLLESFFKNFGRRSSNFSQLLYYCEFSVHIEINIAWLEIFAGWYCPLVLDVFPVIV